MTTPIPPASFLNFLGGLAGQALMSLGEIPNPLSGRREANLDHARYTLQLLEVLQQKTAGNRSPEEEAYLGTLIGDLQARLAKAG